MEEIKFLDIVFENVESIIIPIERIEKIEHGILEFLKEDYFERNAYQTDYLKVIISYENESELVYDATEYDEPLGMFIDNPLSNRVQDRPNILGRLLQHNDVVCIQHLDENEKDFKTIYVPWSDQSEYTNHFMTAKAENGFLTIEFKKQ